MRIHLGCALVLSGLLGLAMLARAHREAPLVGHAKLDETMSALEDAVARRPDDGTLLADLAGRYLDRGAPGMALGAILRAPAPVREAPGVAHLWARALLHEGQASRALVKERQVLASCIDRPCAPWLLASAMRHEEFLVAMVGHGVEDFQRDPDGASLAYGRLRRSVVAVLEAPGASDSR
jgi:hypothetical protein